MNVSSVCDVKSSANSCDAMHHELSRSRNVSNVGGRGYSIRKYGCDTLKAVYCRMINGIFHRWWTLNHIIMTLTAVIYICSQPLGKFLSFLEATIAIEGMGRPRGFWRFRKTHLENILPRGSRDRDPRYPKGIPWDQNFLLKFFFSESYLGVCMQVWGLLL